MLINLSNHPSSGWGEQQMAAATAWGEVVDIPFPQIDPEADESVILTLAREFLGLIQEKIAKRKGSHAVHLMGEHTFCFAMAQLLHHHGLDCMVSTTHRQVTFEENGDKTTRFRFVKFRKYPIVEP